MSFSCLGVGSPILLWCSYTLKILPRHDIFRLPKAFGSLLPCLNGQPIDDSINMKFQKKTKDDLLIDRWSYN